ncbi:hypothetical protein FKW77_010339 [Venturia effusa]|uniref:Uncharacterized protein n=1 Tax=Venturia effusa TaxID=50376 RepID=A0A517L4I5_9PEZI|nr:hypothetical protein FKW77_010339 [Venturia effusa]
MARKTRAEAAATANKGSTKRQTPPPKATTLAKRPKRQSTMKAAPIKSDYFSHESSAGEEDDEEGAVESPGVESSDLDSLPDDEELEMDSDVSAEDGEDLDVKPKGSRGSASAKKKRDTIKSGSKIDGMAASSNKSVLWRPGVSTGMEAGTQVIIRKPKPRDAGKTPYADDTIHPNTLLFLEDLAANNDRGWLKMHDPDYRTSQKDFNSFLEVLTQKVVEADDTVPELPVKDIIMRIYRDIRFSKDPTPYKVCSSHAFEENRAKISRITFPQPDTAVSQANKVTPLLFLNQRKTAFERNGSGGLISPTTRPAEQNESSAMLADGQMPLNILAPSPSCVNQKRVAQSLAKDCFSKGYCGSMNDGPGCIVAHQWLSAQPGGRWTPEASAVALLRRDIDRSPQRIKAVLKKAEIRKEFLDGVADIDAKVVKKFVAQSSQSALKTKPKGFDADHKDIDLLRLKSFTLTRKLADGEVLGERGLARIAELIATLVPFITYLNSVVMPDDEDEDEVDEDEDEDDVEVDN